MAMQHGVKVLCIWGGGGGLLGTEEVAVGLVAHGEQVWGGDLWAGGPCNGMSPGISWDETLAGGRVLALGFPPPRGNRRTTSWISPCCAPSKRAQPRGVSWWPWWCCWGHLKLPISQHPCPSLPPEKQRGNLAPEVGAGGERLVPPSPPLRATRFHRIFCSFLITNT